MYQQYEQSPLPSNHLPYNITMTYGVEDPCSGLGQAQPCAGFDVMTTVYVLLAFELDKLLYPFRRIDQLFLRVCVASTFLF